MTARQPQQQLNPDNNPLGYYCPTCLKPVQQPTVWHPECRPAKNDPARYLRICPGCLQVKTLEYRPGRRGNNSPFHDQHCKKQYAMYMNTFGVHCYLCHSGRKIHTCCWCGRKVCVSIKCKHWKQHCYPTPEWVSHVQRTIDIYKEDLPVTIEDVTYWKNILRQGLLRMAIIKAQHKVRYPKTHYATQEELIEDLIDLTPRQPKPKPKRAPKPKRNPLVKTPEERARQRRYNERQPTGETNPDAPHKGQGGKSQGVSKRVRRSRTDNP